MISRCTRIAAHPPRVRYGTLARAVAAIVECICFVYVCILFCRQMLESSEPDLSQAIALLRPVTYDADALDLWRTLSHMHLI
jgi:hypothetical protein